ncbi:MAG: Gfo/Idh/MocA family protein [Limisphaerales bacterium]|jgi:predicted dehydrogenase
MNAASTAGTPINVAVAGLGFMGVTHLRAYLALPQARVVAVCDSQRLPVNGVLAGVTGNITSSGDLNLGTKVRVYRRLEELLADPDVQVVDLCTPTPLHPEQAVAALKAGKHVLCEKPLARTSAAARDVVRVADRSPGSLMPAMCMRFWPGWSWLKGVVEARTYGAVLAARFRRVSAMPAWSGQGTYAAGQTHGGALFDLHIHDTDFVSYLFGRPAAVSSAGVTDAAGNVNHVVTHYHYPGGPAVHAEGSWLLTDGFNMAYTLHCEHATLDYDLSRGAEALRVTEKGQPTHTVHNGEGDGYSAEIGYFISCVASGHRPAIVTGRDAVTALEICEAEEQSVRTGQPVKLG